MTTTGYESSLREQELADIRSKLAGKRRRLMELEKELMMNSGEPESGGRLPTAIQAEIDPLRREITGLAERQRELAEFIEGPPDTVGDTTFERLADFFKSYWIYFALALSTAFFISAGEIAAYFGKSKTDAEAAEVREGFSGAGQAQVGEILEHFEEQGQIFDAKYNKPAPKKFWEKDDDESATDDSDTDPFGDAK